MPIGNRRRELICLGYLFLVAIAFRIWILVIDSYNTYLEIVASIVTFFVVVGIFIMLRRRQRLNEAEEEDEENVMVNLDARDIEIARFLLLTYQLQPRSTHSGLNQEVISRLPRITYSPSGEEEIDSQKNDSIEVNDIVVTSPSSNAGTALPTCSICLDNYAPGDVLIQLPCHHDYHERCISTWLVRHPTCPLCARSIVVNSDTAPPSSAEGLNPREEV